MSMSPPAPREVSDSNSESEVVRTLHWLASLTQTRLTGTADEKLVQQAIETRLAPQGFRTDWRPFRFPRHIYGSLAMHFGLALGLLSLAPVLPWLAALGHLLIAYSFYSEAVLRRHVLRKLWPAVDTQNLLMTWPARAPMKKRIVFLSHVDSAFTGFMFEPPMLRLIAKPPPAALSFLRKQLFLPWACLFVLAALEFSALFWSLPSWLLGLVSLPFVPVFLLNLDIVIRNRPVPGAADNLSGCAAQIVLAEQWCRAAKSDVEVVFAFTGAEEAGTGGAAELAKNAGWDSSHTEIIVLDTLSNGTLHVLEEGELFRSEIPRDLREAVHAAARLTSLPIPTDYIVPAGGTDALPFLAKGFRAIALTCIDPAFHAPRHYHHPTDTAANLDPVQLDASTKLASQLLASLAR
jgi:hypothetical protein